MKAVKNKHAPFLLSVSLCIAAILFVLIGKTVFVAAPESSLQAGLPLLLQLELENEQLTTENEQLWSELSHMQSNEQSTPQMSEQLETTRLNAAQIALSGPGIVITLDDSDEERVGSVSNYVIHEEYLRQLVNVLWSGGAEAIAVNDQRLTSQTEIFCSGAFIQINGTRQSPPYRIVAIGKQADLRSALQFYFWEQLGHYQLTYGITRELEVPDELLSVPAGTAKPFRFAEVVREAA
jgi:uncharacterized protein YlxW (UPF0749 family)